MLPNRLEITPDEFKVLQKFLCDACGIVLNEGKEYLVKSRLAGVLRDTDYASVSDLVKSLRAGTASLAIQARVVDAMTTNETFWFRDPNQFVEFSRVILPELVKSRASTLRIWSAASSSGQEPYSISMCVEDFWRNPVAGIGPKKIVQILGTDISTTVLTEARQGVYSELALSRGLSPEYRSRYFQQVHGGWKLSDAVTSRVRFQQFNLLKPYTALGKFDVIFCRNVLIYFSEDVKRDMISRMARCLNPGGYFLLSSTEALPRGLDCLEPVGTASVRYYRLKS
ncbi:CheR family methyltransferase [Methylogaea oryzae]|uniref:protein-glutamate O-methyltransferase n=1 Tax=Methylogaea oryzae TaxID=1295382 RepID=A0A8D5AK18_9GAMM|nr:protein-glutamate O-methyltransferase CheR [Methylogaea oryzae]BBL70651.1 chemotaxis protein methyltransferase 1 [Methylogaea oryzae]